MDFSKALIALKAGCEVRRPCWPSIQIIGKSQDRNYMFSVKDVIADDWEIVRAPQPVDGESMLDYIERTRLLRHEFSTSEIGANLVAAELEDLARAKGFFGVDERAGRESPECTPVKTFAKGSAVSAGQIRDEAQKDHVIAEYGLVIEFGSAEALREAMRLQRVEFSVFGVGAPA